MDPPATAARPHASKRSAVDIARDLPAIELPLAATRALSERDDIAAMAIAQEAARRIGAAPAGEDWLREARRIAADMEWNGGGPGPLFDRAKERLGLLAPDGTILFVGQRALDVLGARAEAMVGKRVPDLFPQLAPMISGHLRRVISGGIVKEEGWFDVRGERLHASWLIVPVWSGGRVVAALLMGADTTDARRASDDGKPAIKL